MRERGTQSRRAKAADGGPIDDPADATVTSVTPRPPTRTPRATSSGRTSGGAGYWPAVAIIAIVVATAGWTTVAVMALNGGGGTTAAVPSVSDDPNATIDDTEADFSEEPIAESHDAPDLEALLPTEVAGTPLTLQSWTGDTLLSDGGTWSEALTDVPHLDREVARRPDRGPGPRPDRDHRPQRRGLPRARRPGVGPARSPR